MSLPALMPLDVPADDLRPRVTITPAVHPLLRLNAKIGKIKVAIYGVLVLNAVGVGAILANVFSTTEDKGYYSVTSPSPVAFVGGFLLGLIPILLAWPGLNFVEAWARVNVDRLALTQKIADGADPRSADLSR
ncbi:hypothetical protein Areg01_74280 [Actinoplanes regularis]|nr:hypothetical protein Areg01_74280 [Actinoplanes regularis]